MKPESKGHFRFADDTSLTMTDYLQVLLTPVETGMPAAVDGNRAAKVDFESFGTKHASLLLQQNK